MGQSAAAIQLAEAQNSAFPDRAYVVELPKTQPLTTEQLTVTENGGPVVGLGVQPPGGEASGAILLIDASNSMEGEPIEGAMAAARAFLAERKDGPARRDGRLRPEDSVLTDFTTDPTELAEAVAEAPPTRRGHAHLRRADQARPRWPRTRGSSGRRSSCSRTARTWAASIEPRRGAHGARRRERTCHLRRAQVARSTMPATLKALAQRHRRLVRRERPPPPRSPRSSRRSASSSRASTRSPTARCSRPSARPSSR